MNADNSKATCEQLGALQESERMYRSFIERSNDGVVVLQDRLIKFVNPRFCEMSGYSADTLLGNVFTDYLTPEEIGLLAERYKKRMAGEYVPPIYETTMTRKDGSKIPLEVSAAVIPFHGQPADLVLVRETTERKQAEEYLQRYRLLSETTGDMVMFMQLDGTIVEANRAAFATHEFTHEELLKINIFDLVTDDQRATLREQFDRARNESITFESSHRRKDGSTFPVEVSASCELIAGEPMILAIARDSTERKRVEAALQAERARLRAVLDALPVAVIMADANGAIVEANKQADVVWGGPVPRVSSISEYEAFKGRWADTDEPVAPYDWAMSRAITNGETIVGEMVDIDRFDGKHGTILNSAAPILDAKGEIIGGIVTEQDITELVHLREALERSLEETQRESRRASALESIAEAGLSIPRLPDLLNAIVERTAKALDVDASCMFVLNEQTHEFEAHAAYNVLGLVGCRVRANEGLVGRVAVEGHPIYVGDAEHDPLAYDSCEIRTVAKSMLGVPLIARGKVVGVTRVQSLVTREFTQDEVRLLEAIADRAAMAIDNARLYNDLQNSRNDVEDALEIERSFSLLLQRALLPAVPCITEGYRVAVQYVPVFASREVGGDFYDIFRASDGWAGVMVGDVSGKGLEAASLAATTRSTIHAFVHEVQDAGDALSRANAVLYGQQPNIESFVTVSLVTIELATGELRYSSAGHPPAVIIRADGRVEFLPLPDLPLGVLKAHDYKVSHARLNPMDKLVLYTDGISEAHTDGGMLDIDGIERILTGHSEWTAQEVTHNLIDAATEWAGGKLSDDAAIVVVERVG